MSSRIFSCGTVALGKNEVLHVLPVLSQFYYCGTVSRSGCNGFDTVGCTGPHPKIGKARAISDRRGPVNGIRSHNELRSNGGTIRRVGLHVGYCVRYQREGTRAESSRACRFELDCTMGTVLRTNVRGQEWKWYRKIHTDTRSRRLCGVFPKLSTKS